MSVLIPKSPGVGVPGWRLWHGHVVIECPKGHIGTYNLNVGGHKIAKDGTVTPSTVCPDTKECTFHEWVKLEGWDPSVTKPELHDWPNVER